MKKIAIIGGGASGLVAAIAAARTNPQAQILIYEKKDSAGKKILATGNGRCNLTNKDMNASYFHSDNLSVVEEVLQKFGYEDTIAFFTSLGLLTKARGNYVYPYSDQASTVLDLLKSELDRLHVKITTDVTVTGISPTSHGFTVLTDHQKQKADAVILACGGKANSKLGSDGSGYALAKQLGHTMVPVVPALVQLKVKNHPFAKAAGVRTDAVVTAVCHGQPAASDHGELQLTAYGISGIPVFQISRYIAKSLYLKQDAKVNIDFLPAFTEEAFFEFLLKRRNGREQMTCADYLLGIFHQKLIQNISSCLTFRQLIRQFLLWIVLPYEIDRLASDNCCKKFLRSGAVCILHFIQMPGQCQKSFLHCILRQMGILKFLLGNVPHKMPVVLVYLPELFLFFLRVQKCQKQNHVLSSCKCIYIYINAFFFHFTTRQEENLLKKS